MKLTLGSTRDGMVRVECIGEVTQMDFQVPGNPLADLLGPPGFTSKVLLSMEKTTFMDSAGIGWLVMSHKTFKEKGGQLVVHSVLPMVDHTFRLLKMDSVLFLAANEAAALALVQGKP